MKHSDYEMEETVPGFTDSSKLNTILPLIKAAFKSAKPDTERCVENAWILGLALKALNVILQVCVCEGGGRGVSVGVYYNASFTPTCML